MRELNWKIGFEIELLAPEGKSRKDLAEALAAKSDGYTKRCFYPQSEPSAVRGTPIFENLILGFDVHDAGHQLVVKCVDDLTIRRDLDRNARGPEGWYRILSDDIRLLRLVTEHCDPDADRASVLEPLARLFGTEVVIEDDIARVADAMSSPVALAAPLPGERERPCELITPPLTTEHAYRLRFLLDTAKELGFRIPHEAAIHMHFDAEKLRDTRIFCRLIRVLQAYGPQLKRMVGTNPNCMRLGSLPKPLFKLTQDRHFHTLGWPDARERLMELPLTKYCDFNVMNFVHDIPGKTTFEVRILPGTLDTSQIVEQAHLFESILDWCVTTSSDARLPKKLDHYIEQVG
jgi:hypothetical protein